MLNDFDDEQREFDELMREPRPCSQEDFIPDLEEYLKSRKSF